MQKWSAAQIKQARSSLLYCLDNQAEQLMLERIDRAKEEGYSLGGIFEIHAKGVPTGLGSHVHWDRRLDGILAGALMSIPAIKGVEIGLGFDVAARKGSESSDKFCWIKKEKYPGLPIMAGAGRQHDHQWTLVLQTTMKPIPINETLSASICQPIH